MTQTQFLLLLISIIPFTNCLFIKFWANSPRIINAASKLLPILFLANLIGLYGNLDRDASYLILTEATRGIALAFDVDQLALGFLFCFNFLWLIFAFYSQRFLFLSEVKNVNNLRMFFALVFAFVNLIIISKNLLSILFFYNCLIILCHFFSTKFLHTNQTKFSRFFTSLLYLESIFFFLAIVATYKFTGQIDFAVNGIVSEKLEPIQYLLLLTLYLSGLFFAILFPFYALYRKINLDPLVIYSLFFLAYGLSTLYIFLKLLSSIFGFTIFSVIVAATGDGLFLDCIEWIFLINIIIASVFLFLSKGLKSSFFYLFFQQFIFVLFEIFIFVIFDESRVYLALTSFLLSITLVFLCVSNFVLYLSKSEHKWLEGLFYNLKITSILFIFGVASLIGIAPSIGAMDKFFLLKIIIQKKLLIPQIIFGVNFVSLLLFSWKVFFPLFIRQTEQSKGDEDLGREIDFDSSLILTTLIVALTMFLGLILFPFLINLYE